MDPSALICGSIAYDNIMVFYDRFKEHILPDQIHILNVAFPAPDMLREFSGCASSIAYNLELLGGAPKIMAPVALRGDKRRDAVTAGGSSPSDPRRMHVPALERGIRGRRSGHRDRSAPAASFHGSARNLDRTCKRVSETGCVVRAH